MLEAGSKPEGLKGLRVLVAEDEFAIAMFLVDYLELKGAQVVGPAGNLQALGQLVDTHTIDVALLDINLGGEQVYPLADRLAEAGTPVPADLRLRRQPAQPLRQRAALYQALSHRSPGPAAGRAGGDAAGPCGHRLIERHVAPS